MSQNVSSQQPPPLTEEEAIRRMIQVNQQLAAQEEPADINPPEVIIKMIKQDSPVAVKHGPVGSYIQDLYGFLIKMPTETVHFFSVSSKMRPKWTMDYTKQLPSFKEPMILTTRSGKEFVYYAKDGEIIPKSLYNPENYK